MDRPSWRAGRFRDGRRISVANLERVHPNSDHGGPGNLLAVIVGENRTNDIGTEHETVASCLLNEMGQIAVGGNALRPFAMIFLS